MADIAAFQHVISADQLGLRPTPAPDIYSHALLRSGKLPQDIVVIEDSRHGVAAAAAAGIREVVGFLGGSHIPARAKRAHGDALLASGARHLARDGRGFVNLVLGDRVVVRSPAPCDRARAGRRSVEISGP